MPSCRRNKRKSHSSRSFKNKSSKSNRNAASAATASDEESQHRKRRRELHDESDDDDSYGDEKRLPAELTSTARRRRQTNASASCAVVQEVKAMGQQESAVVQQQQEEQEQEQPVAAPQPAKITLKVVQFIGDAPKVSNDEVSSGSSAGGGINEIENDENNDDDNEKRDNKCSPCDTSLQHFDTLPSSLVAKDAVDSSSYRVDSPKPFVTRYQHQQPAQKRHAMLIQEISESSSSEEVREFLANSPKTKSSEKKFDTSSLLRNYRVDSPSEEVATFDNNNNHLIGRLTKQTESDVTVHEVSESSSNESVSRSAMAKPPPTPIKAVLKIINIKELPSVVESTDENFNLPPTPTAPTTPVAQKKLNKAEEAMLEALYGDKKLLEIPNLPLDVISEEGSDCGSDVERQPRRELEFAGTPSAPQKPPRNSRRRHDAPTELPMLISTKLIDAAERSSNSIEAPMSATAASSAWASESFVSSDASKLQAELVYLTSASSSATDLSSQGDGDDTEEDEEHAENSEDTETNSMLDNVSVPSLHDMPIEMRAASVSQELLLQQSCDAQALSDILEEDEDQSHRSLVLHENEKESTELSNDERQQHEDVNSQSEQHADDETIEDNDDKSDNKASVDDIISRLTPQLTKQRKNSSDSSSSANSQCTIIRHSGAMSTVSNSPIAIVHPLHELCSFELNGSNNANSEDVKITVQKRLNSASYNAPPIPTINELELHYNCNHTNLSCDEISLDRDKSSAERVITILQVPPDIAALQQRADESSDNSRWVGLPSAQIPNLVVALSPSQNCYREQQEPADASSADVLLDMHKKFVERRAYHEVGTARCKSPSTISFSFHTNDDGGSTTCASEVRTFDEGYAADRETSTDTTARVSVKRESSATNGSEDAPVKCDKKISINGSSSSLSSDLLVNKMNHIRKCMRDEFFKSTFDATPAATPVPEELSDNNDDACAKQKCKQMQLESELKKLDRDREELEVELRNLQSLQHFKSEELAYAKKRHDDDENNVVESDKEFINLSDEKRFLQQIFYNEWQDKILERYERRIQKSIKITPVEGEQVDMAKFAVLENEFMSKLRERRERLSLINNELTSSTESLSDLKRFEKSSTPSTQQQPHVLHEFLKFYNDECTPKQSDESGESTNKKSPPVVISLMSVSFLCGLLIGKYLTTNPKVA